MSPQVKEERFLRKGQALLKQKDYARALLEFKNAASAMPRDSEPQYQMGLAYLRAGHAPEAVRAFRKALELDPKHAQAQLMLAEVLTTSRDKGLLDEAASRLQAVLEASPGNTEASDALAVAELELGKTDDAGRRLEETLRKFPADLQASLNLALLKLSQKDLAGVEQVLQSAVANAPQSPQVALALAQVYMMMNQPAKAEPQLRRAVELDSQNAQALAALAALEAGANHLGEAERLYARLATLPDKRFQHLHAVFLYETGKRDAGLTELQQLVRADPADRSARDRLIGALVEMNRIQEAESLLSAALQKNPNDLDALFQQSQLDLKAHQPDEAEKHLKLILHFRPESAEAHYALASVYKAEGLQKNERQELNEAVRLKPNALPLKLALARNFTATNEGQSALQLLDQIPPEQQNLPAVLTERNWALLSLGRNDEVDAILKRTPPAAVVGDLQLQKAVVELRQRKYEAARASAEAVLHMDPDSVRAAAVVMQSYTGAGQARQGLQRLAEIAAARPQSAPLQFLLGQWFLTGEDTVDARKAFAAAKSADGNFVDAELSLAEVDRREHQLDAARERLQAIVAENPNNTSALLELADVQKERGDQLAAFSTYKSVLAVDGSNLAALSGLAYLLAESNPDAALNFVQKAGELAPDNPGVEDSLGFVYYRKGLYSSAVDPLKSALTHSPTPQRQFHLAMAYLKSGNKAEGERMLADALRQNPQLPKEEHGW